MGLGKRLEVVGGEHETLAAERVLRGQPTPQVLIGDGSFQCAQGETPELLGLVAAVLDDSDVGFAA